MSRFRMTAIAALGAALALPAAAKPADPPACGLSDLSGVTVLDCTGFIPANLLSNSPAARAAAVQGLSDLGMSSADGSWIEKQDIALGSTISFATPLYGISYIGLHKGGAGEGGPGTALYRIDAGTSGLTTLDFERGGLSAVALYSTSVSLVPEPAAAMLLLAGLGVVAVSTRRRRQK